MTSVGRKINALGGNLRMLTRNIPTTVREGVL